MFESIRKLNMAENEKKQNKQKPSLGNGPQKPDGDFDWSKIIRTVFSWGAVIVAAVIVMQFMRTGTSGVQDVTFDVYENFLRNDKIVEAKIYKADINDYRFEGVLAEKQKVLINNKYIEVSTFSVTLVEPLIQDQVKIWNEKNIKYTFVKESSEWFTVLIGFLPWIILFAVWILIFRRMQGGGAGGTKGIFNFGKSKAKLISESAIKITFKDVAGADEAIRILSP